MSGNMYSHPSNRMWKLLTGTYAGKSVWFHNSLPSSRESSPPLSPSAVKICCPSSTRSVSPHSSTFIHSVGFVDINTTPNSHSDSLSLTELYNHRDQFYTRLQNHLLRVQRDCEDSTVWFQHFSESDRNTAIFTIMNLLWSCSLGRDRYMTLYPFYA